MLRKIVPCCLALALSVMTLNAAEPGTSSKLQVDQTTDVPGASLKPGAYTLSIVDHLSDRYIMRVEGGNGADIPTFLAIPNASLKGGPGEIKWAKSPNGDVYLKGWNFAGGPGPLEFVYPKDDAVALAKANGTKVAAIDPASEGRVSNNGLSKEDMREVTLWLLSPTHVGPGDSSGGIKAEKYQQLASNTPPAVPTRPSVIHKPASLPHTASYLPLIMVLGLGSLVTAAGLRFRSSFTR
jgi:hypothetical protein